MRDVLKYCAEGLATLTVLPALLLYRFESMALGEGKVFQGWSQLFGLIPGLSGVYLRRAFYRLAFRRCARGAWLGFGTVFSHSGCSIGRSAYVGVYCCLGEVTLEDDVLIGSHVSIMNGSRQHGIERLDVPVREQPGIWQHVTVGRDSWVGDRAVVMADVGRHCVVGAGSVVTAPVPDYAIVVGVPARVVGRRRGAPEPAAVVEATVRG